jgi:hypothetical protein
MIIKKAMVCIGGSHYIDAKLGLTTNKADALVISGSKNIKQLIKYLKSKGVFNITLSDVRYQNV